MAVTINASTTSGLIQTADTSGILQLQTANTTAVTVDASQNVGVGNTSPSTFNQVTSSGNQIVVGNGTASSPGLTLYGPAAGTPIIAFANGTTGNQQYRGYIQYDSTNDKMNINASSTLSLQIGGTERARIDSSGNLLVNTTTLPSSSGSGVQIYNNSGQAGRLNIGKNTTGLFNAIANYYSGTYVGGVNYDNTSTSFPTSSDIRLKKDIVDAGSASAKIDQIRIVSHGWKHDDAKVEFGVIAQELVNVAPQAVSVGDTGEEVETTWGVDYSKLVPMLIKAIQEQQALIQTLTARIEALEGAK